MSTNNTEQLAKNKISAKINAIPSGTLTTASTNNMNNFIMDLKTLFSEVFLQSEIDISQINNNDYFKKLLEKNNLLINAIRKHIGVEDQALIKRICITAFQEFGREQLALKNTTTMPAVAPPPPPPPKALPPTRPIQNQNSAELATKLKEQQEELQLLEKFHDQQLQELHNVKKDTIESIVETFNAEYSNDTDFQNRFSKAVNTAISLMDPKTPKDSKEFIMSVVKSYREQNKVRYAMQTTPTEKAGEIEEKKIIKHFGKTEIKTAYNAQHEAHLNLQRQQNLEKNALSRIHNSN